MAEFVPLIPAEENNDTSWYTATAAGIASGIIKVPEGIVSLAAELIDLGLDSNKAAEVEKFFDKINPFEEVADDRAIGKLTEALVSIGIPGAAGFRAATKLADKALKAKRAGTYANLKSKNLMASSRRAKELNRKAGYQKFAAGVFGGAAGEAFVADVEEIGTFGDLLGGPTDLDRDEYLEGRPDAIRKLLNRVKFGSESLFITPFVAGAGKGAKALATRGAELAYSDNKFYRWIDRYVGAPFRPRGDLPQEVFLSEMRKQGLKSKDINRAKQIVNQITKITDKMFPDIQSVFDKSVRSEREQFLKKLNDALFGGDLRKGISGKQIDEIVDDMKAKNMTEVEQQNIVTSLNEARLEMTGLVDVLDRNLKLGVNVKKSTKDLQEILKERIQSWVGTTYKIYEHKSGLFNLFRSYKPTDEAYTKAVNLFRRYIAKNDKTRKTPFDQDSTEYVEQARSIVDDILDQVERKKKPGMLPDFTYINKTLDGQTTKSFEKLAGKGSKVFRELFGEIQDPRYSIFNAITNLSAVSRTLAYLDDVALKNDDVIAKGGRGFFWANEEAAKQAVRQADTGIELVEMDDVISLLPGMKNFNNPLQGKWTTREIADGIKNANDIASGLSAFVRGREAASGAEKAVSWFYRNLLLVPKGISQLAKTVLSIPTHIRNFLSAGAFAGANGVLFENPKLFAKAFQQGIDVSGLLKLGDNSPQAQKIYNELVELGVVNSQVQIGDLKALLRDVRFGEQLNNTDAILRPMMARLKKLGQFFQGKYVAEDDTWKITNYVVELNRIHKARAKQAGKSVDEFLEGLGEVEQRALKEEAATIVKNTVPNYAYVGSAVKTSRLLPIGNFMSFPSEMLRTTTNIAEQGIKELKHSRPTRGSNITPVVFEIGKGFVKNDAIARGTYGTGFKRISGMAVTVTGVPVAVTEGAKALYDVTEEEIDALRQFVPEWSKNSTLIPIRDDDGELRYIDFSHSNAYDVISRPYRTLINNILEGQQDGDTLLSGFVSGVNEASAEIMNPFISESIWTEAITDLTVRGGITPEGRRLYTDQTSAGDKLAIRFLHLGEALAPSYKQFQRLGQAAFGIPTKRGEELDIGPELAGFMGLRPIKVNPLESMGFKIAEYQTGIRNARREFTGGYFGLLRGGRVTPNEIIERYLLSNAARFNVQKEMYKNINAAGVLGVNPSLLKREFDDRQISAKTFNQLRRGRFDPYFPSQDIQDRFREIAANLGELNPYKEAAPILRLIRNDLRQLDLGSNFDLKLEDYLLEDISLPAPQTSQLTPSPDVITQGQNILGQGQALAQGITPSGLTPTEEALLSDEEKLIRRRQRGLV